MLRKLLRRARCAIGGHDLVYKFGLEMVWECRCGQRRETYQERIAPKGWDIG